MKKLILIVLLLSFMSQASYAQDKIDDWAVEGIAMVENTQIVRMDRFVDYDAPITREMYGYIIYQLYEYYRGAPIAKAIPLGAEVDFSDIDYLEQTSDLNQEQGFVGTDYLYLNALKGAGLVEGYPDGSYKPLDYITREEIMTLYVRLIESLGYEMKVSDVVFADEESISEWSKESVKKCYEIGLVEGVGDQKLNPKGYATIQETLVVMSRILEYEAFKAQNVLVDHKAQTIVSNGRLTYGIAYDVFGREIGIDLYEDYTFIDQVYEGRLGNPYLYLEGDRLYFFDEHNQLLVLDGEVSSTNFMMSYSIDQWFVESGQLIYDINGVSFVYELDSKGEGVKADLTEENFTLTDGVLMANNLVIEESVKSYCELGDLVYYLTEEDELIGHNISDGQRVVYDGVLAESVDLSWNYLIIEERAINGSKIIRHLPVFALEHYLE